MSKQTYSLKFGIEVVIVVVVLAVLFATFGAPGDTAEREPDTGETTETQEMKMPPQVSAFQEKLESSGMIEEYTTTDFPKIEGLDFYDPSRFVEVEVAEYKAGHEYYLTFDHTQTTDYQMIGEYYGQYANANGWNLTFNILGGNGTHSIFDNETMEVEAMAIIRQAEGGGHFVREKTRVYVTN